MELPPFLYHVCRASDLDAILRDGLDPRFSQSRSQAIYLASAQDVAFGYASFDSEVEWALLVIDTSQLDVSCFGPDDYELQDLLDDMEEADLEEEGFHEAMDCHDVTWQDSMRLCHQVTYWAPIPPEAISVRARIPAIGSSTLAEIMPAIGF